MSISIDQQDYTIGLTARAARVIHDAFAAEQVDRASAMIRVGAHAGGCSGYKYDLDFAEAHQLTDQDCVFESEGVRIAVDRTCLTDVLGSLEIDYQQGNLIEAGFVFRQLFNGAQCGCGKSFAPVKGSAPKASPTDSCR